MRPNIVDYEENPVFVGRLKDHEMKFLSLAAGDNRSKFEISPLKY